MIAGGRPGALARRARAARDVATTSAAGRARLARAPQPPPLRRLHRPRRASRCCSSASRRRRRSRRSTLVELRPGQTTRVGDYDDHLRASRRRGSSPRPTAGSSGSTSARSSSVRRGDGKPHDAADRSKSYFPQHGDRTSARSRASSRARRRARSACRPGSRRDLWTAVAPDIGRAAAADRRGRQGLRRRATSLSDAGARRSSSPQALAGSRSSYTRRSPPPATFRFIASPLVTWIWLGALIVLGGALDRAVARRRPARRRPATRAPASARVGARARARVARSPDGWRSCVVARPGRAVAVAAWSARRCARARRARGAPTSEPSARTSRPRATPSTRRSATPSSTSAPASCPRPTGARSTASCGARRSRSCTELDALGRAQYPGPIDVHDPLGRRRSSSPSS